MSILRLLILNKLNDEEIFNLKEFIKKYFPNSLKIQRNNLVSLDENIVTCKICNSNDGGTIHTKDNFYFYLIESNIDFEFNFEIGWLKNSSLQNIISFNSEIYNIILESYHNHKDTKYCTMLYRKETDDDNRAVGPSSYDWYLEIGYEKFKKLTMEDYRKHYSDLKDEEIINIYNYDKIFVKFAPDWYGYSQLYHINIPKYKINKDIIITGAYKGCELLAPKVDEKINVNDYERIYLINI